MTKLQKAQQEVNRLWKLMCAEEGVPVDAKFVVFNSTNKHSVPYNTAVKKYFYEWNEFQKRRSLQAVR